MTTSSTSPADGARLTPDEVELLVLLAGGLSGAQLSQFLEVNPRTVQRRIERLRQYFGVATTVEAVVAAVRHELI